MTEQELKTAREQFLIEGLKYYIEDPSRRAVGEDGKCKYRTADGRTCFIGRKIEDGKYTSSIEELSIYRDEVQELLDKDVLDLGESFLSDCQIIHDGNEYWSTNSLSDNGIQVIKNICKRYRISDVTLQLELE